MSAARRNRQPWWHSRFTVEQRVDGSFMGKKYDGYVAGIRAWMERSQSWLERNPDYAAKKRAQLAVLTALTPDEIEALESGNILAEPQLARIASETGMSPV